MNIPAKVFQPPEKPPAPHNSRLNALARQRCGHHHYEHWEKKINSMEFSNVHQRKIRMVHPIHNFAKPIVQPKQNRSQRASHKTGFCRANNQPIRQRRLQNAINTSKRNGRKKKVKSQISKFLARNSHKLLRKRRAPNINNASEIPFVTATSIRRRDIIRQRDTDEDKRHAL